jgi:hypothetical protein
MQAHANRASARVKANAWRRRTNRTMGGGTHKFVRGAAHRAERETGTQETRAEGREAGIRETISGATRTLLRDVQDDGIVLGLQLEAWVAL